MKLQSIHDLFLQGLKYVYDAEQQLTEALPELAKASTQPELRAAFEHHLQETKEHATRLQEVFKRVGQQPSANSNTILKQYRQEAQQLIQNTDASAVRDAALIVAGNQVEHYEIACYGSLRTYAQLLGKNDVADLLQTTLDQEKKADAKLTQIGEDIVNKKAAQMQTIAASR
jgi:ferritin-like metal-binding protein YciE